MSSLSITVPLAAALLYLGLVGLTLSVRRESPINRAFAAYLVVMMVWSFTSFASRVGLLGVSTLWWSRLLVGSAAGLSLYFYQFVRSFLGLRRHRWLLLLGHVLYGATVVLAFATNLFVVSARVEGPKYYVELGPALWTVTVWGPLYLILSGWPLMRRYFGSEDAAYRERVRYPLIGITLVVLGAMSNYVPVLSVYPVDITANAINAVILAYGIQRYQLISLTPMLRGALSASLAMMLFGNGYLISFVVLEQVAARYGPAALGLAIFLGAVVSMGFAPIRNRWQRLVNRVLFRREYAVQRMLERLSSTATSILELEELTQLILDEVMAAMGIQSASMLLRDAATGEFSVAASMGLQDEIRAIRWPPDHPVLRALASRQLVTRSEVNDSPEFMALWGREREEIDRLHSEAFVPLHVQADLIGVLAAGPRADEAPYTPADHVSLMTLANQTAVAVENARLYAMEQRRLNESLILLAIAEAVGSTLDLTRVLKLIAQRTAEAAGVHRCSILMFDEEQRTVMPLMSQFASGVMDEEQWQLFQSDVYRVGLERIPALQTVIRDREPLILRKGDTDQIPMEWLQPFKVQRLVVIPLISRDQVIGVMVLDHVEPGRGFEQEQINLAMTIASHAAAAVENARLYQQTIEEKARSDVVLQETFSGIVVVDGSLRILSMNPGAEQISGYAARLARGKLISELFGSHLAQADGAVARAVESGEKIPPLETTLAVRQGNRDVLLGVTPLTGPGRAPDQYLLSFADISKLKEVDRLKTNIVANVSHELRTPLSSIKAYAELLLMGADANSLDLRQEWLSVIDREADRLAGLVNNLLELSRLESEYLEIKRVPVDLGALVSDLVTTLTVQAERRGIHIEESIPPGLPALPGEEGLIRSAIRNLLSNAIKFSHDGGRIRVSLGQDGDNITVSVQDEGIGIPEEAIAHLFTKFYRVRTPDTAEIQGTGLGLALAKEAVQAHGGNIEVQSELGEGTVFMVTLPAAG
jgi:PAS domain S-box-containing protein